MIFPFSLLSERRTFFSYYMILQLMPETESHKSERIFCSFDVACTQNRGSITDDGDGTYYMHGSCREMRPLQKIYYVSYQRCAAPYDSLKPRRCYRRQGYTLTKYRKRKKESLLVPSFGTQNLLFLFSSQGEKLSKETGIASERAKKWMQELFLLLYRLQHVDALHLLVRENFERESRSICLHFLNLWHLFFVASSKETDSRNSLPPRNVTAPRPKHLGKLNANEETEQ